MGGSGRREAERRPKKLPDEQGNWLWHVGMIHLPAMETCAASEFPEAAATSRHLSPKGQPVPTVFPKWMQKLENSSGCGTHRHKLNLVRRTMTTVARDIKLSSRNGHEPRVSSVVVIARRSFREIPAESRVATAAVVMGNGA